MTIAARRLAALPPLPGIYCGTSVTAKLALGADR